jgi:transcriptional regulator with PAS, ATPase and Fis domain
MTSQRPTWAEPTENGAARASELHTLPSASVPEILICDPDPARGSCISAALAACGRVLCHSSLGPIRSRCENGEPAIVLLSFGPADNPAPEASQTLEFLRTFARRLPVLVFANTGQLPIGLYCQPLAAGARQVLNAASPTFLNELTTIVERLTQDLEAQFQEHQQLGGLFARCGLIAQSVAMREVFRRALKASHFSDLPVLIKGETGTGKQRLAEAIHALDPCRRDKPFITINCGALTRTLAESELFGHSRGAFSGAVGERQGLFRAANGGTLMLDEVGELDSELQPKLLRVLQERRLLPVGEDYEHPIDVRIIAATNRPLENLIAQGRFREDLYQRLNVLRIQIPPLRERPDDVEVQARHFLAQFLADGAEPVTDFGPRVVESLRSLPWPGNTRQLENLIREALAHREARSSTLEMSDLPRWVFEAIADNNTTSERRESPSLDELVACACEAGLSLSEAVEEYERRLLMKVLEQTGGNRTHAAQRLGLTPRTIFAKVKKYQIG